jgi:colanic acid/amylovoran biosynthesis protein
MSKIILLGGQLFNKGAQAMVFAVVDEIKSRCPDAQIFLLSTADFQRSEEEKGNYKFSILPFPAKIKVGLPAAISRLFVKTHQYDKYVEDVKRVIEVADAFVDVSGYALGSQWGFIGSLGYLLNIRLAKKFGKPIYILSQSIGPFDYPWYQKILLFPLLKYYLRYPVLICAREQSSFSAVKRFSRKNLIRDYDIVLKKRGEMNVNNIFHRYEGFDSHIDSNQDTIAVVPNKKILTWNKANDVYSLYSNLISKALTLNKSVSLVSYSDEDLYICQRIKNYYQNNDRVVLLEKNYDAIALEKLLSKMPFIVASRYHAIIHAYRNGVPAIVIGWSQKYRELMVVFNQEKYYFDIREKIDLQKLATALDVLAETHHNESLLIKSRLRIIQNEENIFDKITSSFATTQATS